MDTFSLKRIRRLLESLGRPQDNLPPVIHIGGTNGKGSVAAFSQRLLEMSGLSVHVHTSPHLIRWNERFRLGIKGGRGKVVDDDVLRDAFRHVVRSNNEQDITIFELSVATAFVLFSRYPADVAIIEVGLGGRLDATNIIEKPAVSVITSISLDHEKYLGNTVSLIAEEKAAIMKSGFPVVIGHQLYDDVRHILVSKATKMGCPYRVYGDDFCAVRKDKHLVYKDEVNRVNLPIPKLLGEHQYVNAATAICAVRMAGFPLEENDIGSALQSVEWFGRLQKISTGPLIQRLPSNSEVWVDGGHNPDSGLVIAREIFQLRKLGKQPFYLILGMRIDKNYEGYLKAFYELSPVVVTVPIACKEDGSQPISADPQLLVQAAVKIGFRAFACLSVPEAFAKIQQMNQNLSPPIILIGGSLYLAGEVLHRNGISIH
ncbi:MAG: bifunctional folylpolyglutamate synthase/dihydrofolate synthase [Candidatus Liberibacter ctenarytainae]|uniref:tetrahydrofolate synthase n=1 Tax=Candidatus Liberibacter ctenarytainae TaxID=2020335 RepID=A0A937AER9_9HYPH|nr:bifunctional folylpolyglutamate synthase/dihydrofolate synthase [Candidatus Liberibacter ctenarytainae]